MLVCARDGQHTGEKDLPGKRVQAQFNHFGLNAMMSLTPLLGVLKG
jgi:hypothetical protein